MIIFYLTTLNEFVILLAEKIGESHNMKIIAKFTNYLNTQKYIDKLSTNTYKVMPIINTEQAKQLDAFNKSKPATIDEYEAHLTKRQLKEARGDIDWKALKRKAKDNMKIYCPECGRKTECNNYMDVEYWIEVYTELDENNKPWQRRCPNFHSVGLGGKK